MASMKLQSSDGEIFEVEIPVIKLSTTIKNMLDDLPPRDDDDEPVPLPNVNAAILRKVIAWCTQHQKDPAMTEEDGMDAREKRTDNIDTWDQEFLKVDQGTLFELILAANYLDIKVSRQLYSQSRNDNYKIDLSFFPLSISGLFQCGHMCR